MATFLRLLEFSGIVVATRNVFRQKHFSNSIYRRKYRFFWYCMLVRWSIPSPRRPQKNVSISFPLLAPTATCSFIWFLVPSLLFSLLISLEHDNFHVLCRFRQRGLMTYFIITFSLFRGWFLIVFAYDILDHQCHYSLWIILYFLDGSFRVAMMLTFKTRSN